MKFIKESIFLGVFFVASICEVSAQDAALPQVFRSMSSYRGPFGKNIIQGTGGRTITPSYPPGKRLFQGAFRSNDSGRVLARNFDFYVGNLFPSNYYELMEEYVFKPRLHLSAASNDAQPDTAYYKPYRELDHEALIEAGVEAMPRAFTMTSHWVLEKYFIAKFSDTVLSKSFQRWGVGDSADEEIYAKLFFNFYLSAMDRDLQYLPAYLLLQQSTVGDSSKTSSLQRARDLVAGYPNDFTKPLGRIRNAIHNQLSPAVIDMIDEYMSKYGKNSTLIKVRSILVSYYSFDPSVIFSLALKLGNKEISDIAAALKNKAPSLDDLLKLSEEATKLRSSISNEELVASKNKTDTLLLLSHVSKYLSSKLGSETYSKEDLGSVASMNVLMNSFFIEGFLIEKNWAYFKNKFSALASEKERAVLLAQSTKIATDTVLKSFQEPLSKWTQIEPKMDGFVDNVVKSSSINTASVILQTLNR